MVAREGLLKDAEAAEERCRVMEAELETIRNEHAAEARERETWEGKMRA